MQNGKQLPFISIRSVRDALENMLYSAKAVPFVSNPLLYLLLIEVQLLDPDLPNTQIAREYMLNRYLVACITKQYTQVRLSHGLGDPGDVTPNLTQSSIRSERGHPELLAWSWLYHHFVRVDLGIHAVTFCSLADLNERTLRRYQQHGIKRLTSHIVNDEWVARRDHRQSRLLGAIAAKHPNDLVGRDRVVAQAREMLHSPRSICLQITGAPGVGKSAIAAALLKKEVEDDNLDHILWIDAPQSVEYIRTFANERLSIQAPVELSDYARLYRIAIVLDGCELLAEEIEALLTLLYDLKFANVILITQTYMAVDNSAAIVLNELTENDALGLIRSRLELQFPDYTEADVSRILRCCGGNPGAIILACSNVRILAHDCPSMQRLEDVLAASLDSTISSIRIAWIACALVAQRPIAIDVVVKFWPAAVELAYLDVLIARNLVQLINDHEIQLSASARVFIANRFQHDPATQATIQSLIVGVDKRLVIAAETAPECLESLLIGKWLDFDSQMKIRWLLALWGWGVRQGRRIEWQQLLADFAVPQDRLSLPLTLGYAICLRAMSNHERATGVFLDIIAYCGEHGLFDEQNRALFELAVVYRLSGRYENAVALLHTVRQHALKRRDTHLLNMVNTESARIAVDMRDVEKAEQLLRDSEHSPMSDMLRIELLLLNKAYDQCLALIPNQLQRYAARTDLTARLQTLAAQALRATGDLRRAGDAFINAVTLIERDNQDVYGLARAWSNLGGLLTETRDYAEAQVLLRRAAAVQSEIRDPVGLAATRHNQNLLRTRMSRR
jgi:tetratricopeptide (TPR) repeat protein